MIIEVYKKAKPDNVDLYYNFIKQNCSKGTSNTTLFDAIGNPQYRKATWVNIGYIIFHELTGINVIMLYSTTMLKHMN